jgi:Protein of unknown function (DUF2505)
MSRSFEISTESPATVEQLYAAFSSEDYWADRFAAYDTSTVLDSLVVEADGTVTMCATQYLGRQLLPGVVAKIVRGDLKISHGETWGPVADREVRGQVTVSAPAGLGSGRAEAWLTAEGEGSLMRFTTTVDVKIPLVGGKFEKSIGADLAKSIPEMQRFTTNWIAEHA